ncbi:diguanylate cyclase domain-containing protein [Rhabdochlamydiaceae symbiont of Dictyostelium giganteum]|uniref:diguanylate cyclase domain-containing protein n=1 Tax=Rhabdochlamydiaceae symbiont of Dictyostelium giganteum TaxID=3342349 RepID=UPI00384BFB28
MKTSLPIPTVLLVSEEVSIALALQETLVVDCRFIHTLDLNLALHALEEGSIDVIIMDALLMEDSSLFKGLEELSQKTAASLFVLTNQFSQSFIQKALHAGASDFLPYPFPLQLLNQRIVIALQNLLFHPPSLEEKREDENTPSDERRNAGDISLLTIEIDFSQNEAPPSEEDLVQLMTALQSNLRKHDILLPQQGGDFVLMLPKTSQHTAELVAEAIRQDIEKQTFPFSISIDLIPWNHSCATCESAAEEFDHLVEVANQVVSEKKHQARPLLTSS